MLNSYLGSQILGGIKGFSKNQFIVITDRYLIVGKYPRIPNVYLYALIPGSIIRPGDIRYGPEDMAKTMEALDKHKLYAVPLEQVSMIDIVMPKRGFWSSKKGHLIIWLANGSQIRVEGTYDCPSNNAAQLLHQLFPGRVRVFNQ